MMIKLRRRSALLGLGSAVSLFGMAGRASLALAAAPTEQRFVVVILRGAMDGLSVVVPYGDPALRDLRGELIPLLPGQPNGLRDLGGFYGLHPALANLHAMYQAGEMLPVHAAAGPYRSRSHFEAQDYLESGADHRLTSGWLNRAVAALPPAPASQSGVASPVGRALAVGVTVPLLLRGSATVASWAPHGFAMPAPDLYARIAQVNGDDRLIGPAIAEGLRKPVAYRRAFLPSGSQIVMAARRESLSILILDSEPMLIKRCLPSALKTRPRVQCPPCGRSINFSASPSRLDVFGS